MNDDITVRELELVSAILTALYGYFPGFRSDDQIRGGKYIDGYIAAIEVVNEALDERGFDVSSPSRLY